MVRVGRRNNTTENEERRRKRLKIDKDGLIKDAKEAMDAGMTYGQWQAMRYLQRTS